MYPSYNIGNEELPEYKIPYVERQLPGGILCYIHALTFPDISQLKRLATFYTCQKKGVEFSYEVEVSELTNKLCQVITACRTEPNGKDMTFRFDSMKEVEAIDRLKKYFPGPVIDIICMESDNLSLIGYVPITDPEEHKAKREASQLLVEVLSEPQTWENFNHVAFSLFGKRLAEVDMPISEALNLMTREQHVSDKLIEALYEMVQAMVGT